MAPSGPSPLVFVEGYCTSNPGTGGWAYVVEESRRWAAGHERVDTGRRVDHDSPYPASAQVLTVNNDAVRKMTLRAIQHVFEDPAVPSPMVVVHDMALFEALVQSQWQTWETDRHGRIKGAPVPHADVFEQIARSPMASEGWRYRAGWRAKLTGYEDDAKRLAIWAANTCSTGSADTLSEDHPIFDLPLI